MPFLPLFDTIAPLLLQFGSTKNGSTTRFIDFTEPVAPQTGAVLFKITPKLTDLHHFYSKMTQNDPEKKILPLKNDTKNTLFLVFNTSQTHCFRFKKCKKVYFLVQKIGYWQRHSIMRYLFWSQFRHTLHELWPTFRFTAPVLVQLVQPLQTQ